MLVADDSVVSGGVAISILEAKNRMTPDLYSDIAVDSDPLEVIESSLETAGWPHERDEQTSIQCVVPTRWGDMGGLFVWRDNPQAVHFSLTLDIKARPDKASALSELVLMINERLWLGHFDFWPDEGVILYRHTIPLAGRDEPTEGEVGAVMSAAAEAAEKFIPAFNFLIWAGKSPKESMEGAMFETHGEA